MKREFKIAIIFLAFFLTNCKNEKAKVDDRNQVKSISQKLINNKANKIDLDSLVVKDSLYISLISDENISRDTDKLIKYYQVSIDSLYDLNMKELKISNNFIGEIWQKDIEKLLIDSKSNYRKEIEKKVNLYHSCFLVPKRSVNPDIGNYEALLYKKELIEVIVATIHLRREITRWIEDKKEINIGEIDTIMYKKE